jgi:hypothetical protein
MPGRQISLAATREGLADDRPLDEALMLAYEAALSFIFRVMAARTAAL